MKDSQPISRTPWVLLQLTACLTLLNRGWLTFRFEHPVRGILWNEQWMTPILQRWIGVSWKSYVDSSDAWITPCIQCLGIGMMLAAIVPWAVKGSRMEPSGKLRWTAWILIAASLVLLADSVTRFVNVNYKFGMLIEHSCQIIAPVALVAYLWGRHRSWVSSPAITLACALTFVGHGLFAVGLHPVPVNFLSMTMELLRCDEAIARRFLLIAGGLDFFVAVAIFVPPIRRAALMYMVVWGLLTALARVATKFDQTQSIYGLAEGIPETLVRTSHWMLPLILLLTQPRTVLVDTEHAVASD